MVSHVGPESVRETALNEVYRAYCHIINNYELYVVLMANSFTAASTHTSTVILVESARVNIAF